MIQILLCGYYGKMGKNVQELIDNDNDCVLVGGVDPYNDGSQNVYPNFSSIPEDLTPDVIIDFSSPAALQGELDYAIKHNVPVVLATTGYTEEQLNVISQASQKIGVFRTANFSLGVNLLVKLVNQAAKVLSDKFDVEIVEKHHNLKKDAPSGTALMLADSVNAAFDKAKPYVNGRNGIVGARGNEIGIHAVRGGTIVGEHEVLFCGEDEIVTFAHSARSKRVFAQGAIEAAKFMAGKTAGTYDMTDVLADIL